MKKYSFLLIASLLAFAFSSCTSDVDDVFDSSSADRISQGISETQNILESATDGWIMEYYGNTSYGGYNVYVKFKDSQATVQSEMFGTGATTSHYSVKQSQGLLLSFDEYNEVFHFFSDPNLHKYGTGVANNYGSNGRAFEGDFEFRIISESTDSLVLEGKKHGSKVIMRKAESGFSWDNFLDEVDNVESKMYSPYYIISNGSDNVLTVLPTTGHRVLEGTDSEGNTYDMPYIVTTEGLKLYSPLTVGGTTITGFKASDDGVYTDDADSNVKLAKAAMPLSMQVAQLAWNVSYSGLSPDYGQYFWSNSYAYGYGEEMQYAIFGSYQFSSSYGKNFGLTFASYDGENSWWGTMALTYTLKSDDEITLSYPDANILNGDYYLQNYGYDYIIYPFAYSGVDRTFKLTCDDPSNPSYILMTDEDDPTNTIRLTKMGTTPQQWPFRN